MHSHVLYYYQDDGNTTKTPFFISLLNTHTFYQHDLWLTDKQGRAKRNCGLPNLSLSFSVIVFSVSGCLIQGSNTSKTGYDRAPWPLVFLRTFKRHHFSLFSKQILVWMEARALGVVGTLTYSAVDVTHLPRTCFGSCWTCMHCGPARILCSWDSEKAICKEGSKDWRTHTRIAYLFCSLPQGTSLMKHKFKDKSKNLGTVAVEYGTTARVLLNMGSHRAAQVASSWSQPSWSEPMMLDLIWP